jgi:hypothetical protein
MGRAEPGPERERPPARVAAATGGAARIANSPDVSKHGGKASGKGGSSKQGGTTAQKKAAGRKGGKAAASKG